MKITLLLSGLVALAAADVSLHSEKACKGVQSDQKTHQGVCVNVDAKSVQGCSYPYRLRIHEQRDCSDRAVKTCAPSKCCGWGGTPIKSIKCI